MLVAGEILNIFLLTGISNINIIFIKKKINVVVYSNIKYKFASTNLTYKLKHKRKKKHYNFFFFIYLKPNNTFFIKMLEDVSPFLGAGQNSPFPLLTPCPHGKVAKALSVVRLAKKIACVC